MLRSINETIRYVDVTKEERRYIEEKFEAKSNYIDYNTWLDINGLNKTLAACKYYYGINAYSELDKARNKGNITKECPRCSCTET